jgi:adenosylcobinamide-phosphate synthase
MSFVLAALALLIENLVGYPKLLQEKLRHPVQWIGDLIARFETLLNTKTQDQTKGRTEGVMGLLMVLAIVGLPATLIQLALSTVHYGWVLNVALATTLIAQKSMRDHVEAVATALGRSLPDARIAVGKIVGRDPAQLSESEVSKAALESLAENTSDGIVAPVLWYALLGLPGVALYKAINTADSMIGHRNERYQHFGWAAARLDDLVNLPASRLTALLFAGATWLTDKDKGRKAWACARSDARKHNSPNAGWPEAAMAGALGLSFGGPRDYEGTRVDLPTMGEGRSALTRADIGEGLKLFDRAVLLLAGLFGLIGAILSTPWASLLL